MITKEDVFDMLWQFQKVRPMTSGRGNPIPNQYELQYENGFVFQSYDSIIAVCVSSANQKIYLWNDWNYSKTTGKYRNMFLREHIKDTQAKINSWEYIVIDM